MHYQNNYLKMLKSWALKVSKQLGVYVFNKDIGSEF